MYARFSILRPLGWPLCFTPSKMGKETFHPPARPSILKRQRSGKGGEAALVEADLDVAVPDALQVDHRRGDVPVAHPLLQGANVDPVLQVSCGVGVPELVEEPTAAKWAVGATIDSHRTILKLMRDSAMAAI